LVTTNYYFVSHDSVLMMNSAVLQMHPQRTLFRDYQQQQQQQQQQQVNDDPINLPSNAIRGGVKCRGDRPGPGPGDEWDEPTSID
jgi:hypothetical protein